MKDASGATYNRRDVELQIAKLRKIPVLLGELYVDTTDLSYDHIEIANVSHSCSDPRFYGNDLYLDITVLNTPRGQILKEIIDADKGVNAYMRVRGYDQHRTRMTDLKIITVDMIPSESIAAKYFGSNVSKRFVDPKKKEISKKIQIDMKCFLNSSIMP